LPYFASDKENFIDDRNELFSAEGKAKLKKITKDQVLERTFNGKMKSLNTDLGTGMVLNHTRMIRYRCRLYISLKTVQKQCGRGGGRMGQWLAGKS
jgi:hypothetical protein